LLFSFCFCQNVTAKVASFPRQKIAQDGRLKEGRPLDVRLGSSPTSPEVRFVPGAEVTPSMSKSKLGCRYHDDSTHHSDYGGKDDKARLASPHDCAQAARDFNFHRSELYSRSLFYTEFRLNGVILLGS
jgi:hypothetical protein